MPEIVLVTEKEFEKGKDVFASARFAEFRPAPAGETHLAEAVITARCRAVIPGVERYAGPLYDALASAAGDGGAIIARFGVGHDGIDKAIAKAKNILVANTPGALDISVAEHAVWLMGTLARHILPADAGMRNGVFAGTTGSELGGKTLGIVGLGPIGRHVAKIAHFGFEMRVLGMGRLPLDEFQKRQGKSLAQMGAEFGLDAYTNDVRDLLGQSDVVSLHLPGTPATHHFMDAGRLGMMKPSAMLINTARGQLIDEIALYDALAGGSIAAAAMDVFECEPYRPMDPKKDLRKLLNVTLTPHTGSNTFESNRRMARMCLTNVENFLASRFDSIQTVLC